MNSKIFLSDDWELRLSNDYGLEIPFVNNYNIAVKVPGTVHTDLLAAKIIDDPYYSDNELKLKWISECDWTYSKSFDLPDRIKTEDLFIIFEGIDTVSEIFLNGVKLGKTINMFLKYKYDISRVVQPKNNLLEVKITSGVQFGRAEEEKHGRIPVALEPDRVYVRKAQYSYGWDWGPAFPTMGLWRPVYLVNKAVFEITDISFNTISINEETAEVKVGYKIKSKNRKQPASHISLINDNYVVGRSVPANSGSYIEEILIVERPCLWYPNGYGHQNLYELEINLLDENQSVIDEVKYKVGIRTIKLELENDASESFRFIVNGKIVYGKGVNWIPGDSFLPRVTNAKYKSLLTMAKDANMNIVRVWGGGIYENNEFYEMCDELGLMVWQDFMFACGAYPEHGDFIKNVKDEINYNVIRLRTHPSIALWCGNNENEWIWSFSQQTQYTQMPGYKIYAEVIPALLKKLDPLRPYWESSPFGFDKDPNSQTSGNRHQWEIWSHWIDYSEVYKDNSLFVTEFGFQGPANKDTFIKYLPAENRKIQDRIFEFHNKQIDGPERVMRFLYSHLPIPIRWDDYIYLAQLNQAFALKTCLEHWRTNQITNGSIIWQLNDTWPVTSWALVDSELTKKMSYHFVKKVFQHRSIVFRKEGGRLKLLVNNELDYFSGSVILNYIDTANGYIMKQEVITINDEPAGLHELMNIELNKTAEVSNTVLVATLQDANGEQIDRNYFVSDRWKHLKIAKADITVDIAGNRINLKTNVPAFFIDLYHPGIEFDKRGFILLPDETITLTAEINHGKLNGSKIKLFMLNNYSK